MKKFVVILVLIVGLVCWMFCSRRIAAYSTVSYVVGPGDTLWGIAQEYKPVGIGTRCFVDLMERVNRTDADIRVGEVLLVPVWEEDVYGF